MLGARTVLGRTIVPDDDRADAPPVALLSSKYWQSRFGGDPAIVGRTVRVNSVPVTIVGVLAPAFTGIQRLGDDGPDISMPLALDARLETDDPTLRSATTWWLQVVGRLQPGATPAQVLGNLAGPFQSTARAGMDAYLSGLSASERSLSANQNRTRLPQLLVDSGAKGIYEVNTSDVNAMTVLSIVVALLLLIVCANVANLLLSRASSRRKEISVRLSLGATRGRLVRQLLTESLLLAATGGALGMVVAHWGTELLPTSVGRAAHLDWRVLAFIAGRHDGHRHPLRHPPGAPRHVVRIGKQRRRRTQGKRPHRLPPAAAASARYCSSCRSLSRSCCSSAPGCSCARSGTSGRST